MDRVLHIPELLAFIFGYLDSTSQVACALVCKGWSDVALDVLWKDLKSAKPLMALLSPLQPCSEDSDYLEFQRPIKVDAWGVFQRYARRVRSLNLDFSHWSWPTLLESVFSEVAQKKPSGTLLPNLTRLKVEAIQAEHLVCPLLFMSENVQDLHYVCPDHAGDISDSDPVWDDDVSGIQYESVSEFFKECAIRLPRLKVFQLSLRSAAGSKETEEHLVSFFPSMQELEMFNCPVYFMSSRMMTVLSFLPALRVIQFEYPDKCGIGFRNDVLHFRPELSQGAFSALVDLSFCATFKDASAVMGMEFAPGLTILYIHSPQLEPAESLYDLILLLSQRRKTLTSLSIGSISEMAHAPLQDAAGHEIDCVTLDTLMPLVDFPNLVKIEVFYHRPLKLGNADIETLIANWRWLEVIFLASDPILIETPTLTPEVLPIITGCCPKLRRLSLYIGTHIDDALPPVLDPVFPTRFGHLEQIEFGLSPLDEEDVAGFSLFISELLPETCNFDSLCGVSWLVEYELVHAFKLGVEPKVVDLWKRMSWALKVLIKAREQERERSRALEREAKDLAMRVAILEEQRHLGLSAVAMSDSGRTCVHQ